MCYCVPKSSVNLCQNLINHTYRGVCESTGEYYNPPKGTAMSRCNALLSKLYKRNSAVPKQMVVQLISNSQWKAIAIHTGAGFCNTLQKILHVVLHILTLTLHKTISQQAKSSANQYVDRYLQQEVDRVASEYLGVLQNWNLTEQQSNHLVQQLKTTALLPSYNTLPREGNILLKCLKIFRQFLQSSPKSRSDVQLEDRLRALETLDSVSKLAQKEGFKKPTTNTLKKLRTSLKQGLTQFFDGAFQAVSENILNLEERPTEYSGLNRTGIIEALKSRCRTELGCSVADFIERETESMI